MEKFRLKIRSIEKNLELQKAKLRVAEQALNDIVKWDTEIEDMWGEPSNRANSALEKIMSIGGYY